MYEAVYRTTYEVVVVTLTRLPFVVAIMAAVILSCLAYRLRRRRRRRSLKWGSWPAVFAVLALYGFVAAWAPAGWDEPLVLLGVTFAALAGYAWLDPARRTTPAGAAKASGGRGWFG